MRAPTWIGIVSVIGIAMAAGCGPVTMSMAPDSGGPDTNGLIDSGPEPAFSAVYAHSDTTLFKVDPDTLTVTEVASFGWPNLNAVDQMTDIALDRNSNMVGISFTKVYSIDKETAACRYLSTLDASLARQFNGLSFVPPSEVDPNGPEILVATAYDGTVWRLDPATGAGTMLGSYGNGMQSSGDVVSVSGFGTVATVKMPGHATDWLVRVNVKTGAATPIGDTGFTDIWGVGFWKNKIYGFTSIGSYGTGRARFILINPQTGVGTMREMSNVSW